MKLQQNPAAHGTTILQAWHEADCLQLFAGVYLQSTGRIAIDDLDVNNPARQVDPDTNTNAARTVRDGAQFQRHRRNGKTVQFASGIKARIRDGAA